MAENTSTDENLTPEQQEIAQLKERLANMELIKANLIVVQEETDELRQSLRTERVNSKLMQSNMENMHSQYEALTENISETVKKLNEVSSCRLELQEATKNLLTMVVLLSSTSLNKEHDLGSLLSLAKEVCEHDDSVILDSDIKECSNVVAMFIGKHKVLESIGGEVVSIVCEHKENNL